MTSPTAIWDQNEINLTARQRGFHLITTEIANGLPDLGHIVCGLCHLFLRHTSASLCVNENADPDVRGDLERWFRQTVRENEPYYQHTFEGPDDMPAHIRSVLLGVDLTIPIRQGRLALGTWQGIYLAEHRVSAGSRQVIATVSGRSR